MNADDWPYRIEPMRMEDVPTVGAIERMVFARPWPVDAYDYELRENPNAHYLVARLKRREGTAPQITRSLKAAWRRAISSPELDKTLLGYGGLWLMVDEAHICTLAVHPAWRQRGIGESLLASLIEKAMALSSRCVTLEVRVSNHVAQHLYEKYGFSQTGLRRGYYSDNNEDAFIMTTDSINSPEYQARFQELTEVLKATLFSKA